MGFGFLIDELVEDLLPPLLSSMKLDEKNRIAMVTLLARYRYKRRMAKRRQREASLEEFMSVRCQRGARYFLVRVRLSKMRQSHKVLKRSFRVYFFRRYKKELRRIMSCWRIFKLRIYVKLIQKIWRGRRAKQRVRKERHRLEATENSRGATEVSRTTASHNLSQLVTFLTQSMAAIHRQHHDVS